jgi:nitroreductase
MDVYDAIRTRRSVRAYLATPIPDDVLQRVLDAARVAPSAGNRQPTRLVLVTKPEERRKLAQMCGNQGFIAEAPVVVVACGQRMNLQSGKPELRVVIDGALAVDHLTLAARAEGLGTCWIGVVGSSEIKRYLGLPDDTDVVGVTPLGYPKGDAFAEPGKRIAMDEFVRWETWRGGK